MNHRLGDFEEMLAGLRARHKEPSIIASMDDLPPSSAATRRLIEIAISAIRIALDMEMPIFTERSSGEPRWFETWPGEHYRLLAALVRLLRPRVVIEIGTFTGMGTLALLQALEPGASITTFDLFAWDSFEDSWLTASDFASGLVRQEVYDVSKGIEPYRSLFASADMIFIDGPKDGSTEGNFLKELGKIPLKENPLVIFDDIRVMKMIDVWRNISRPKLDVTSFGHWSGTGLVDWSA